MVLSYAAGISHDIVPRGLYSPTNGDRRALAANQCAAGQSGLIAGIPRA